MHCVDCGYNCHEKCMSSVPKSCTKLKTVTDNSASSSSLSQPSAASSVGENRMCEYGLVNEPSQEIMAFFVLRKLILQMRMHSHPVEVDVWFLMGPFVDFHTSCVRTVKALARLRRCTGSPETSLIAYVISTIISRSSLIWVCTVCPDLSVRKLRNIVVLAQACLSYYVGSLRYHSDNGARSSNQPSARSFVRGKQNLWVL